ncbi:MAG: hypothetical protein HYW78_02195 [Parcubacteria group bacterium]|nr:hypothetical protein [Parcubacteria group bacterium]
MFNRRSKKRYIDMKNFLKICCAKNNAILYAVALFFLFAPFVFAAENPQGELDKIQTGTGLGKRPLSDVIGEAIKIALGFLGVIVLLFFIAGGFLWMTSGGSEEKIKKAKKMMAAAVVGLVIILISYSATTFVLEKLQGVAG